MGWAIRASGEPTISHTGDTFNFHSDVTILPARRLGVVVLMNVNGYLAGATNAQSVIAQGVQRLLLGRPPPAPSGFWPRYLVFDAALLLCAALATRSLLRLLSGRGRRPPHRPMSTPARAALPLLWEIALPVGLLIGFPSLSHASWPLTLLDFPDLGYWLLALCAVLLATGGLRVVLAVRSGRSGRPPRPLRQTSTCRPADRDRALRLATDDPGDGGTEASPVAEPARNGGAGS
jgi:hypothetical protein